jgi:hypothetical protein
MGPLKEVTDQTFGKLSLVLVNILKPLGFALVISMLF